VADDLFTWIDACWNKGKPEGTPPTFMMHRFMASDPDMAQVARELQVEVREPQLIFPIWKGYLPKGRGAPTNPRLQYVAAKKGPAAEELVTRMQKVLSERREVIERMISLVALAGKENDLYWEYGIKPPKEEKRGEGLI